RIIGALEALLIVMKGLPLAYQKDMQEDKEGAMDAFSALMLSIAAMTGMVRDMAPDVTRMRQAAGAGYSTATDLADWLVRTHAVPRGESCHRANRGQGGGGECSPPPIAARRHAGDREAHYQGRVRGAHRRRFGKKPRQPWRHRPQERAPASEQVA